MQNSLLPCRKCGESDYDMWGGRGTQAEMSCNSCGQSESIQVSDLFEYEERFGGNFDFDMNTLRYPEHAVDRAKKALIEEWNTRAPDNTAQLREALDSSLQTNQAICKKMMMLQDLLLETISTFRHIGLNMKFGDIPNKDAIEGYCKKIETALAGK